MKTWIKLRTKINHDPEMGTLSWAQRGIWAALLALAGEIDDRDGEGRETGLLDTLVNTAWRIRADQAELNEAVAAFRERGWVAETDGRLCIIKYRVVQERAPSDSREAVAERVKRSRANAGGRCNEGVTSAADDVTSVNRGVTASDSESDTESESDAETDTHTAAPRADVAPAGAGVCGGATMADPDADMAGDGDATDREELLVALGDRFASETGIAAPKNVRTQRQRDELREKWVDPLMRIGAAAGWNQADGEDLIHLAVERLRGKKCSFTCPRSIADTVVAIAGETAARKAARMRDLAKIQGLQRMRVHAGGAG